MLPHDDDASRLAKNCYHWPEFFQKHGVELSKLDAKATVWGHCHHKATGGSGYTTCPLTLGHAAGTIAHKHYSQAPQKLLDDAIEWLGYELGITTGL